MFFEDLVREFSLSTSTYELQKGDSTYLEDVGGRVLCGSAYSTKQVQIYIKILNKNRKKLTDEVGKMLEEFNALPEYKTKPYEAFDVPREVRTDGRGNLIFRFKNNQQMRQAMRKINAQPLNQFFDPNKNMYNTMYIISVDRKNLDEITNFIKRYNFSFDDETLEFFVDSHNIIEHKITSKAYVEDDVIRVFSVDETLSKWMEMENV